MAINEVWNRVDAAERFNRNDLTDAERAEIVAWCAADGMKNHEIRQLLNIKSAYCCSHYKKAGQLSEEELNLWHNNPHRISLGHVRAIAKLPHKQRENLLRSLLVRKRPVSEYEKIGKGLETKHVNITAFEKEVSDQLGKPIDIKYNNKKRNGSISIFFEDLGDLNRIVSKLGFKKEEF